MVNKIMHSINLSRIKMWFLFLLMFATISTSCVAIDDILFEKKTPKLRNPLDVCVESNYKPGHGEACLECHEDLRENHHPVDFTPPDIDLVKINQDEFPLFDGEIQCFTCHIAKSRDVTGNSKLLRGGPYSNIRQLCFKCHYQEKYAQINVHKMHAEDGGLRTIKGKLVCTFCHPENINQLYSTETVKFKADVPFLCLRCHPEMRDPQIRPHFMKVPNDAVKEQIKNFEAENNVILPLVPRGKISCATCHNPHEKGVLIDQKAMAGADSPHRLRIVKSKLCYGCHLK